MSRLKFAGVKVKGHRSGHVVKVKVVLGVVYPIDSQEMQHAGVFIQNIFFPFTGGIEPLVEFLTVNSDVLQAASAAAIASLTTGHKDNQDSVVAEGAVEYVYTFINFPNLLIGTVP